ncbi:IS110 family transposase [Kocuria arenosa]|uniref:IS110 family transposase n=1 Tax=Kocuria arenosa TaxID=3071446 RepID=UPI0034D548E3
MDGISSYGAQLARQVRLAGYRAVETARMSRVGRRGIGKSDPVNARRIAAALLTPAEEQLRTPRMDEGIRAATRILLTARDELTRERTRAVNALTALVRIADLGIDARRPSAQKRSPRSPVDAPARRTSPPGPPAPRPCAWPRGFSPKCGDHGQHAAAPRSR